ncbi:hypothetical protein DRW03_28415 [Corallococcus sp. H22C18031201]|nr:hypothetical protein [Citreicoccus inhibens]RJS17116.1 hypothetical protein DRW03_28415 [Corallococcus sp. H22C18031201]
MNGLARGVLVAAMAWLSSCTFDGEGGNVTCDRVTVFARPSAGGGCQSFDRPCDVPGDYVQCCGGFLGGCPGRTDNAKCVDDPTDSCNPSSGGADCPGICH